MMSTPAEKPPPLANVLYPSQNFNTPIQSNIGGQYVALQSERNRTNENVHCAALYTAIPAQVEKPRSLDVIFGRDFLIAKRIEQFSRLGEHCPVPDAGQYFLPNRANNGSTPALNGLPELREHPLLARIQPCLVTAP
jgi:hypothetical protein